MLNDYVCPYTEGQMVLFFDKQINSMPLDPANFYGKWKKALIISVFPLLQVADILLSNGKFVKRASFRDLQIIKEDET